MRTCKGKLKSADLTMDTVPGDWGGFLIPHFTSICTSIQKTIMNKDKQENGKNRVNIWVEKCHQIKTNNDEMWTELIPTMKSLEK